MKSKIFVNLLIPAAVILAFASIFSLNTPDRQVDSVEGIVELHFIDVGQGDCMLANLPDNKTMLIDAGAGGQGDTVLGYLKRHKISKIDFLIATHPHEDHIGGMDGVVQRLDIGEIHMPKVSSNTKAFENLLTAVKNKGLKVKTAKAGVVLHDENGLKIEFVAPNGDSYDEINNYSAVTKITYKNTSFLLTGDAEAVSENEIQGGKYNIRADVLKIGHHGSATSSSDGFLKAVSPKVAVISVGEGNSYNHPAPKTIKALEALGIDIYRTDEVGTIIVRSDGESIKVIN